MSKRYHFLRHPRTTQERRHNVDAELAAKVRPNRNAKRLPNTYDDIPIPYRRHTSWKKLRIAQYRVRLL